MTSRRLLCEAGQIRLLLLREWVRREPAVPALDRGGVVVPHVLAVGHRVGRVAEGALRSGELQAPVSRHSSTGDFPTSVSRTADAKVIPSQAPEASSADTVLAAVFSAARCAAPASSCRSRGARMPWIRRRQQPADTATPRSEVRGLRIALEGVGAACVESARRGLDGDLGAAHLAPTGQTRGLRHLVRDIELPTGRMRTETGQGRFRLSHEIKHRADREPPAARPTGPGGGVLQLKSIDIETQRASATTDRSDDARTPRSGNAGKPGDPTPCRSQPPEALGEADPDAVAEGDAEHLKTSSPR